ncbi:discoidin domain-containing protein [Clostridium sp. YIM B02505]|uniref:Discoidin domain-containing protein n=1 Tax=Clostridium yunnanense TaxID=2800325 RepID=A0ABS1EVZ2_9CLOT|nr:discoidin domain-containing protein [Clostridium yunnanense]MBK1813552.1 discoidin domain-containing protein [Clostridium yunnanense]
MFKKKNTDSKKRLGFLSIALVAALTITQVVSYGKSVSAATRNIATGKSITASDTLSASASLITDGDVNSNNLVGVTQNLQWIQIDLGQAYNINKINLWHYFADGRTYHDVIARVSNDPSFSSGVTTVFNNDNNNSAGLGTGNDAEYAETSAGKAINFSAISARYVRLYSNGSSANIYNHYVEVQIWTSDEPEQAVLYQDINYGGTSIGLPVGNYTLSQLNAAGIPDNWMSSLKVPAGWTVEAYADDNFLGTKWTFTTSSTWIGTDANDKMSSVKIYKGTPTPLPTSNIMFDDFNYNSSSDGNLATHGWTLRNEVAGPGPSGCKFSPSNISFLADSQNSSNKLMRLTASTNGTGAGTSQAEIYTTNRKYNRGTYAARVRFTDTPISGTDGAEINETFFAISPLEGYRDPSYSELDFEYLANGGWGEGQGIWTTSWHTYTADPWYKDGSSKFGAGSYAGWHNLVMNVASDGTTTYFIDGRQFAQDTPYFGPRKLMSINFNLWFITGEGENPLLASTYVQDVDWVYHAKDTVLSPSQVDSAVQNMKASGINFTDTVK